MIYKKTKSKSLSQLFYYRSCSTCNLSFTRQIFLAQKEKKKKKNYQDTSQVFQIVRKFQIRYVSIPPVYRFLKGKKGTKMEQKKVRVNAARPITFPSGVIAGFGCNQRDTRDLSRIFHPASSTKRPNLIGLHRRHCSIPKSP